MLTRKESFTVPSFHFENAGKSIPVTIGYETYGTLDHGKDNCVLICHYFTGTSHAAGMYHENDAAPGWWDALIGPGKVIDTDRYFVISSDVISNINFHNPQVITTGPPSIDPETGKEYGTTFPIFTLKDVVRLQHMLLESLGIQSLRLVAGPSMGGLQAFMWGRHFPGKVDKIIALCSTPMITPFGIMVPNQLGINAIMLDPDWNGGNYYNGAPPHKGLLLAFENLLMATRTDSWATENFGRRLADPGGKDADNPFKSVTGKFLVQKEVENIVLGRMEFFDANSYLYIAKANTLFDLCEGDESFEAALARIKARTLMIIDDSDLMFTREQAEMARACMSDCECFYYNSHHGHLSCLYETDLFKEKMQAFIGSPTPSRA